MMRSLMICATQPNIIRMIKLIRMRWAGRVARMGDRTDANRILVGRPEGMRTFGRPRRRWEGNIKIDLQDVGWGGMDWTDLAESRDRRLTFVNAVMNM